MIDTQRLFDHFIFNLDMDIHMKELIRQMCRVEYFREYSQVTIGLRCRTVWYRHLVKRVNTLKEAVELKLGKPVFICIFPDVVGTHKIDIAIRPDICIKVFELCEKHDFKLKKLEVEPNILPNTKEPRELDIKLNPDIESLVKQALDITNQDRRGF